MAHSKYPPAPGIKVVRLGAGAVTAANCVYRPGHLPRAYLKEEGATRGPSNQLQRSNNDLKYGARMQLAEPIGHLVMHVSSSTPGAMPCLNKITKAQSNKPISTLTLITSFHLCSFFATRHTTVATWRLASRCPCRFIILFETFVASGPTLHPRTVRSSYRYEQNITFPNRKQNHTTRKTSTFMVDICGSILLFLEKPKNVSAVTRQTPSPPSAPPLGKVPGIHSALPKY